MERPEEWSGVGPASVLTDHSGQVVLHSLQYVERCSRRAVEYCVAVVQPGRDDATRDGLGKVMLIAFRLSHDPLLSTSYRFGIANRSCC